MNYSIPYGVNFKVEDDGIVSDSTVTVGLWAPEATAVEFCVFSKAGDAWVQTRIEYLENVGYGNWLSQIGDIHVGDHYGFRVHGKWDPENGYFFNPAKLLVDPYAKSVHGHYNLCEAVFPYETTINENGKHIPLLIEGKLVRNCQDSAPHVPHSVVVNSAKEPNNDKRPQQKRPPKPNVPWGKTVIYEAHVIGLTKNAPWLPQDLRGTYAGLGHAGTVEYLSNLGISAIELLPIHSKISEMHLLENGLENYWGYSNLSYFAPEPTYATEAAQRSCGNAVVQEVKQMVDNLHSAGIEVILDVVYNHTCEESNYGPMLCYRGIANRNYYKHIPGDYSKLDDTTGCGNSLDFTDSHVVKLAIESLKYWAGQIGVDGFRFDLMVTCARGEGGFTPNHPFLVAIKNDPLLGNCKIIAEPWDLGIDGWKTGGFGFPFAEWNDSFRNHIRAFWVEDLGRTKLRYSVSPPQNFATKLAGSSDIFANSDPSNTRGPYASINYVTAHDGFTMFDLVSYNEKHNEPNGEDNRDGTTNNSSYNHGFEGETKDEDINAARHQTIRNLLATLILSTGVPMITSGDELGRTQLGNNNAYCQNSEVSWIDWDLQEWQQHLISTVKYLISIKREYPALRQNKFFSGIKPGVKQNEIEAFEKLTQDEKSQTALDIFDLCWFHSDGKLFTDEEWQNTYFRTFQAFFSAPGGDKENANHDILIVINGAEQDVNITLPKARSWEYLWNSTNEKPHQSEVVHGFISPAFSMQVFRSV